MTKAEQFAQRMQAAREHERSRPFVEVKSGDCRVDAEANDVGALMLRASRASSVGQDYTTVVEISPLGAIALARWILDTFDDGGAHAGTATERAGDTGCAGDGRDA